MNLRKSLIILALAWFPGASNAGESMAREAQASFPPEETSEVGFIGVAPAPPPSRKPRPKNITGIGVTPAPKARPILPGTPPVPPVVLNAIASWSGIFIGAEVGGSNHDGILGVQVVAYSQFSRAVLGLSGGIDRHISASSYWTGTTLARLGYALNDSFMPYLNFGPAFTNSARVGRGESISAGWTVGIGFDYRLSPDWSATGSLNYYRFHTPLDSFARSGSDVSYGELRAGLMYRLPPISPTK